VAGAPFFALDRDAGLRVDWPFMLDFVLEETVLATPGLPNAEKLF
jgi:hypothetical protein